MNNRELKFRTWDRQNKEFAEWTNRDPFFDTSNGKIFFWERVRKEDGSYDGDIILQDYGDRFVLQQYTGLKDSKGNEIYEGDILMPDTIDGIWPEQRNGVMVKDIRQPFANAHLFKIVGNIMQNPELIKNK
jgi:hypothetical protein